MRLLWAQESALLEARRQGALRNSVQQSPESSTTLLIAFHGNQRWSLLQINNTIAWLALLSQSERKYLNAKKQLLPQIDNTPTELARGV